MIVHCSWKLNTQIIFYSHLLLKYYFFLSFFFPFFLFLYPIQSYFLKSNSELSLRSVENQVLFLVDLEFDTASDADGIDADVGHLWRLLIEVVVAEGQRSRFRGWNAQIINLKWYADLAAKVAECEVVGDVVDHVGHDPNVEEPNFEPRRVVWTPRRVSVWETVLFGYRRWRFFLRIFHFDLIWFGLRNWEVRLKWKEMEKEFTWWEFGKMELVLMGDDAKNQQLSSSS